MESRQEPSHLGGDSAQAVVEEATPRASDAQAGGPHADAAVGAGAAPHGKGEGDKLDVSLVGGAFAPAVAAVLRQCFDHFDSDGDGMLRYNEFCCLYGFLEPDKAIADDGFRAVVAWVGGGTPAALSFGGTATRVLKLTVFIERTRCV